MNDLDLLAIKVSIATAHDHVCDIAQGKAKWTMRIPADEKRDSDLVLSKAFADAEKLLAEVERLSRELTDAWAEVSKQSLGDARAAVEKTRLTEARVAALEGQLERWEAGDDTWRSLVFAYVNAPEGSDACSQAWHEMEAAVRHYEAVERRTSETDATPTGEGPPMPARTRAEAR